MDDCIKRKDALFGRYCYIFCPHCGAKMDFDTDTNVPSKKEDGDA